MFGVLRLFMLIEKEVCRVCGEEHGLDDIHIVEIKGKKRAICKGCSTVIHGLV